MLLHSTFWIHDDAYFPKCQLSEIMTFSVFTVIQKQEHNITGFVINGKTNGVYLISLYDQLSIPLHGISCLTHQVCCPLRKWCKDKVWWHWVVVKLSKWQEAHRGGKQRLIPSKTWKRLWASKYNDGKKTQNKLSWYTGIHKCVYGCTCEDFHAGKWRCNDKTGGDQTTSNPYGVKIQ